MIARLPQPGYRTSGLQPAAMDYSDDRQQMRKHFKIMRFRLLAGLLAIFVLPHALFTAYFHIQFTQSLKKSANLNLAALSESQGNTIDLFLQERVVNLFNLFHGNAFTLSPSGGDMVLYLHNLRQVSDAFVDVGFMNQKGIQIGYAGPFPYLQGKNYSNEKWFTTLMGQDKGYFISDIHMGFRNKPHFTIATRQMIDGQPYIMRSTLDPDKFYMFLRTISHGKGVESALINDSGYYQIVDPDRGKLLGLSDFIPSWNLEAGVHEIDKEGHQVLIAYTWLKEAHWALLVRQPLDIVHAHMFRMRRIMIISLVSFLAIAGAGLLLLTKRYIDDAQAAAEKSQSLQSQLFHAAKLASIGELATGVAHEINNPLAIITATSGVIKDMLDPKIDMTAKPEEIMAEIRIIESAAFRAGKITRKLLNFGHKEKPSLAASDINAILDGVVSGFKAREFELEDIEIIRRYGTNLPKVMIDPDQFRQVFLNIINNAGDAIEGAGKITLSTLFKDGGVVVTIKDSGAGMSADQIKRIFEPFYTTKEAGRGTGLGLSVSLNIVESMGGSIDVQSLKGEGSSFTVTIPHKQTSISG